MMLASSLDASRLVSPSRVLYPGSMNTACLRRCVHAPQRRVIYTRPSAVDGPALNASSSSSTRRRTPRWLPCSRPPMRRREGIARAAASPSVIAADDSGVVAHVGPLLLTRQDCIRYIVPAAALRILTSCLDGKGILLLAQGTVMVMAAAALAVAVVTTMLNNSEYLNDNWLVGGSIMACTWWACKHFVTGFWRHFLVPITVSYPFYTGTLPVLAPAALFIKQHPAIAAGCYSVAKAIPYALCIAAAVAIVRRAAAHRLPAPAVPSKAASPAAGTGDPGVVRDTFMPDAITVLQAETSCLWTRLDGIAKRLGAVEDYSGDDEAQNMPLRRVGELENKLAQVARLLASEIEELKEAVADQKEASETAGYVFESDLRDWDAKLDAAAAQMQRFQEGLHAANAKHMQLLEELAGKADATAAAGQEERITESMQQISTLRQQLLEHSRLHSAAQQAHEADINTEAERLDAAERSLEELEKHLEITCFGESRKDKQIQSRLDKAEEQIAALQRTSEEAAAAAAAAASGGNSFQARLFQAEDRIKGLACLVEQGLSNSEGDIAELKRRLDGCAEGSEGPDKDTLELRLHASEEEIAALKRHVGGYLLDMNGEDCLENRVCRAEAQLHDLKETARAAEREVTLEQLDADAVVARLEEAEKQVAALKQMDADDVMARLNEAEDEIAALKEMDAEALMAKLDEAEKDIAELDDDVTARLDETENEIIELQRFFDGANVLERLEEAEDEISELRVRMDELKAAPQPALEAEQFPESKPGMVWQHREVSEPWWREREAKRLKESQERPENSSDDTGLEQKLQDIQSGLHSELRGDYWGLDIKGFQAKDAAMDRNDAEQVVAPVEDVPEGSELQLVKPRPAPEPEKATGTEPNQAEGKEASDALDREGVTSEKIQALKRTLDTRAPSEALPATSKTVAITWEEEEASPNPTLFPCTDESVAGDAPEQGDSSAADSAAADETAADDMAATMAAAMADVAADVSSASAAAELAAADAATAAAAAAASAGAVAAAAVTNAQSAADRAAANAAAAAAASMAATAVTDADVAAAADVSRARTAAELAAAFSQELAAQWAPEIEYATKVAAGPARKVQSSRPSKRPATLGEREVSILMVDDIPTQPTKAEVDPSSPCEESNEKPQPKAGATADDTDDVSDDDSFELVVETDELWNLMVDAIASSEKPQRKAAADADDSADVSDDDSFELDVELWNSMLASIDNSDKKAERKAEAAADSDDDDDDASDEDSDEDSFSLDVETE